MMATNPGMSAGQVRNTADASGPSSLDLGGDIRVRSRPSSLRLLLSRKASAIGLTLYALVIFVAIFAPLISPYNPLKIAPAVILQGPTSAHWLGTDELGRDVLTRIIYGARVSIAVSVIAVAIALVCGIVLGMISGYRGGAVSSVIMRSMDALAAFPAGLLALAIA